MRTKTLFSFLLWILTAVLMLALAGCGNGDADRIAQLERENAQLQRQLESLTAQLEAVGQGVGLSDWDMDATAWSSSNGANVTITATPLHYAEGQSAALIVTLEGEQVANSLCKWDGTSYTASVDLNAADGYCYYVVLTAPDGSVTEVEVNTPMIPANTDLINLEASLNAYCSIFVEEYTADQSSLTLNNGYAQIQLPRIPLASGTITCLSAELILEHDGQTVSAQTLTLPLENEENSFLVDLTGLSFSLPQLQDDQQLDLWLKVTCSDDQVLSSYAGTWYYLAGELSLAVG